MRRYPLNKKAIRAKVFNEESGDWSEYAKDVAAREYDVNREQPTPEQLMIKVGLKQLTPRQQQIWELSAYADKTQEEIGIVLGISQSAVGSALKAIQLKVEKWCKQNRGAYMLLKLEQKIDKGE